MKIPTRLLRLVLLATAGSAGAILVAQNPTPPATSAAQAPSPGPGGPGGPGGRGPGGPQIGEVKIVAQFDKNGDGHLDATERAAAREYVRVNPARPARRGGGGGRGGAPATPPSPGVALSPADVKIYGREPFYDPMTLRTLFVQFEGSDWEKEMEEFHKTDVDVPATLTVDGKVYRDVGFHFRGASSYSQIPFGMKRSLAVALDSVHDKQTLFGFRTLNLLNSHEDASFIRPVLYSRAAQDYLATPRMNLVRVVINGENWGIYASAEQFNKEFTDDRFKTTKGARWKVPGSPGGRGSLAYLGDASAPYKAIYEIKSKDDEKSWAKLARVCKVLNETAPDQLEAALKPLFDIDGALKFLALEMTFVNGDGYWTRTSDYSIAEDAKGVLHIVPHDMNETFSFGTGFGPARGNFGRGGGGGPGGPGGQGAPGGPAPQAGPGNPAAPVANAGAPNPSPGQPNAARGPGGPGGGGGGRGGISRDGGTTLDPLIDLTNVNTPLVTKLLAVPALQARYFGYIRDIATRWLDWSRLGPIAEEYHTMIDADVKRDTRKLETYEDFVTSVSGGPRSLKAFAEQRRAYLLNHPEIKKLAANN